MKKIATFLLGAAFAAHGFAQEFVAEPANNSWTGGSPFTQITLTFEADVTLGAFPDNVDVERTKENCPSASYIQKNNGQEYTYFFPSSTNSNGKLYVKEDDPKVMVLQWKKNLAANKGEAFGFSSLQPVKDGTEATFIIPGSFYKVGGVQGETITLKYQMSVTEPVSVKEFAHTILPAPGEVKSFESITVDFGDGFTPEWDDKAEANVKFEGIVQEWAKSVDGTKLVFTPGEVVTTAGSYELNLPEGSYKVNGISGTAISAVWTLPMPEAQDIPYTVTPVTDQPVMGKFGQFELHVDGMAKILNYSKGNVMFSYVSAEEAETTETNWFAAGKASTAGDGFVKIEKYGTAIEQGVNCGYGGQFDGGWVWINIRENTFAVNGVPNKPITLKYYISNGAPTFFVYDAVPVVGQVVDPISVITMDFYDDNVNIEMTEECEANVTFNGEASNSVAKVSAVDATNLKITIEPALSELGDYKIVIPAAKFHIQGLYNPEMALEYKLVEKPTPINYAPKAPIDVMYQTNQILPYKDPRPESTGNLQVYCDYGFVEFYVPMEFADEHEGRLDKSRMYYRVLVDNGEESVLKFEYIPATDTQEERYEKLKDGSCCDSEGWIQNKFTEYFDFILSTSDEEAHYHKINLYNVPADVKRLGVQTQYRRNSTSIADSEITWVEPTIPSTEGTISWADYQKLVEEVTGVDVIFGEVDSIEYFDLQGRKVTETEKGFLICKTRFANGEVRVSKVIRK